MTLSALTPQEREIVRRSMEATFQFFDFDFHSRLGVEPEEMRSLLAAWPAVDDGNDGSLAALAINNSLNDLLNGTGISDVQALHHVGTSRAEMARVYRKWTAARGWKTTGLR